MPIQLTLWLLVMASIISGQTASKSFEVSGSLRSRMEGWDWFQAESGDGTYAFSGNVLRVAIQAKRKRYDWTLEMAAPLLVGLPADAVAAGAAGALGLGANYYTANHQRRVAAMIFPKQAFVDWKLEQPGGRLRLGRFEFVDGTERSPASATLAAVKRDRVAHRLIGHFAWTAVGRSFDGAHFTRNLRGMNLTVVAAAPTRGVFQVDGWGPLRVGIGYAALSGGTKTSDWRVFGLYYRDWRQVLKTDNRAIGIRRGDLTSPEILTYGGHWLKVVKQIDLMGWGALQTGQWGRQAHLASTGAIEVGWQPKFIIPKWKPWLRGGYFYGSGDKDPNDSRHGTFFEVLPTPRVYARMPFYNLMNSEDRFLSLILRPSAKLSVRSDLHALRLSSAQDLWYAGGGAFQPWSFGYQGRNGGGARSLANLVDAGVDWNVRKDISVSCYYGRSLGRSVVKAIYAKGQSAQFGYLEVSYRF